MAFVDSPHFAWPMSIAWVTKHFLTSLGTLKILTPYLRPRGYGYHFDEAPYEDLFNGNSGPYFLLNLYYEGQDDDWFDGNYVKIICDGEEVYESGQISDSDLRRYVGRDGVWGPLFFAKETMIIQTRPRWVGSEGTIRTVIMEFAE